MKRFFDFCVALLALVLLAPLLMAVAALVRWRLGAPILFSQQRPGLRGRVFKLWKFRSMTETRDAGGHLLSDAERLPPFGRWLRATSLDELPELWNVLRGEMSLVGPRPLLVAYLDRYTPEQARRHEVRPGLTGWAQLHGRNATTWEERLRLDVWYVDHRSFRLDLTIIVRTFALVFARRGISSPGAATMPEFNPPPRSAERRAITTDAPTLSSQ
jgi:lipopolysaccharide/colanic/teichoic acid biosynthesis glycosyltransferase